ncbi:MAG: hypothetical protein ACOZHQ_10245 [Thermodesulfobacteriota bacterium]
MTTVSPVEPLLREARSALVQAQAHFAARQGRLALNAAYVACAHAAHAFWRASRRPGQAGLYPARPSDWHGGRAGKSLVGFYAQFGHVVRRTQADPLTQVNIEEAANWLRQAGWFVERIGRLARRMAG